MNPFGPDPSLRGLISGLTAHDSVNIDEAKEVGELILKSMVEKRVTSVSFEEKKQAVTLATKTAVKIDDECVQVDPQLIFQRLSLIATNGSNEDPASFFKYELCTHPAALFDDTGRQTSQLLLMLFGNWLRMKTRYLLILYIMYLMEGLCYIVYHGHGERHFNVFVLGM